MKRIKKKNAQKNRKTSLLKFFTKDQIEENISEIIM